MSPVTEGKLRLGGMALRNGLLVHGPTHWAAAVRAADGSIKVASGPKPRFQRRDIGVSGQIGLDDIDCNPGFGAHALGQRFHAADVARGEDEIVAALRQPIGIDRADAARCASDKSGSR